MNATRRDSRRQRRQFRWPRGVNETCRALQVCASVCVSACKCSRGGWGGAVAAQRRAKVKYTRIYCTACCVWHLFLYEPTHCLSLSLSLLLLLRSLCNCSKVLHTHTHTKRRTYCTQRTFDFVRRKVHCKLRCSNAEAQLFVSCSAVLSAARVFREN